jgi:hypothetical protein
MLNALVSAIDKTLRARQGIFEYSDCPRCIFRVHVGVATTDIALSDGTALSAGGRLLNLHLWNEHVPPFPDQGPTIGWARRMCQDLEISLRELASFIASNPALDDIEAVGGKMVFGSTEQGHAVAHLAERYGFVCAVELAPKRSISQALHRLGENILISMIVMSRNPAALRADCFSRDRVPVYLRRHELMKRFGTAVRATAIAIEAAPSSADRGLVHGR